MCQEALTPPPPFPPRGAPYDPWPLGAGDRAPDGLGAFYRGCLLNAFKSAPAAALTFVCNDLLRDYIG